MKKDKDISRRKFLQYGPGAVLGGALALGAAGSLVRPGTAHATLPGYLPCDSSHLLDVDMVKKYAWMHFNKNGG